MNHKNNPLSHNCHNTGDETPRDVRGYFDEDGINLDGHDFLELDDRLLSEVSGEALRKKLIASRLNTQQLNELRTSAVSSRIRRESTSLLSIALKMDARKAELRAKYIDVSMQVLIQLQQQSQDPLEREILSEIYTFRSRPLWGMTTAQLNLIKSSGYEGWPQKEVDRVLSTRVRMPSEIDAWRDQR